MDLVLALAAYISMYHATAIAPIIVEESRKGKVDPFLVAAIIQKESKFKNRSCYRGAHGLMQIQVKSRSCSKKGRLRSIDLYNPRYNIKTGIRLMNWAKRYCRKKGHRHHWLLHYNQGVKVKTNGKVGGYPRRVLRIYKRLKRGGGGV